MLYQNLSVNFIPQSVQVPEQKEMYQIRTCGLQGRINTIANLKTVQIVVV